MNDIERLFEISRLHITYGYGDKAADAFYFVNYNKNTNPGELLLTMEEVLSIHTDDGVSS